MQTQLSQLPSEIVTQSDVDAQLNKISVLKKRIVDLASEKKDFLQGWRDKKEKVAELRNLVQAHDPQNLKRQLKMLETISNEIVGLQKTLTGKKHTERVLENSVSALDEVPCGDSFPTCKFITSAHESKGELRDLRVTMSKVEDRLGELSGAVNEDEMGLLRDKIEKIETIITKADAIERDVTSSTSKSGLYDEKIKITEDRMTLEETQLEKMLKHVSTDPENNKLDELKVDKIRLEKLARDNDGKQISLAKSVGRLQGEIEQLREERKRFEELTAEWKIVELGF